MTIKKIEKLVKVTSRDPDPNFQRQKEKTSPFKPVLDALTSVFNGKKKQIKDSEELMHDAMTQAQLNIVDKIQPKYTKDAVVTIGYDNRSVLYMVVFDLIDDELQLPQEIYDQLKIIEPKSFIIRDRDEKNSDIAKIISEEVNSFKTGNYPKQTLHKNKVNAAAYSFVGEDIESIVMSKLGLNYKLEFTQYS